MKDLRDLQNLGLSLWKSELYKIVHFRAIFLSFWFDFAPSSNVILQISKILIHLAVERYWLLPKECLELNNSGILHSTLHSELSEVGGFVEKL